jgi:hypothetical protein
MRGASPKYAAHYLLEDTRQLGVDVGDMVDFCLTPSSVGGVGLGTLSGQLRHELTPYGTGRWRVPRAIESDKPTITAFLGAWRSRCERVGFSTRDREYGDFIRDLVNSWGIPQRETTGVVTVEWHTIEQCTPLPIEGGFLPQTSEGGTRRHRLINTGGSAIKFLFGNPDREDWSELEANLATIKDHQGVLVHVAEQQRSAGVLNKN